MVVNYDLPWNPDEDRAAHRPRRPHRTEARRRALNFVLEDTVEHRVREVLEAKLQTILEEFGVDKASDVLDSAEAEQGFETVYVEAMLDPTHLGQRVDSLLSLIRARAKTTREGAETLATDPDIDPQLARGFSDHPLPSWVETNDYRLPRERGRQSGARSILVESNLAGRRRHTDVVFNQRQADEIGAHSLSLEDPRVRGIAATAACGARQPISDLATAESAHRHLRHMVALADRALRGRGTSRAGSARLSTRRRPLARSNPARHVWDRVLGEERLSIAGRLEEGEAIAVYDAKSRSREKVWAGTVPRAATAAPARS